MAFIHDYRSNVHVAAHSTPLYFYPASLHLEISISLSHAELASVCCRLVSLVRRRSLDHNRQIQIEPVECDSVQIPTFAPSTDRAAMCYHPDSQKTQTHTHKPQ